MPPAPFCYQARPTRVIDGDTFDCIIDLGFGLQHGHDPRNPARIRLLDVDTPELRRGSEAHRLAGRRARQFVTDWMRAAHIMVDPDLDHTEWSILIRTQKDDAFGRYLATVWAVGDMDSPDLGTAITMAGLTKGDAPA